MDGERRETPRLSGAAARHIVSVRIRPGHRATVVDVSAIGARLETDRRLLPGSIVELQMETEKQRTSVRGRILRCMVARVSASHIAYHGAIVFDRHLPWFASEHGRSVSDSEQRSGLPAREDTTHVAV